MADDVGRTGTEVRVIRRVFFILPGVLLCVVVTLVAIAFQTVEVMTLRHPYIEAIVMAILVGAVVRTIWQPHVQFRPGIAFSAKQMLEVAVALLGSSITFTAIASSGPSLLLAIVTVVLLTLMVSFAISRALGLPIRLSILIACGNAICGNSAIAAVAPVIGANTEEIASSISFTAVLGVIVVLSLPLLIPLLSLSETQYGILAGMTVYAVPQVLAATVPSGLVSVQIGTLVKLIRVMMLGPVVAGVAFVGRRLREERTSTSAKDSSFFNVVPWFIVAFFLMAGLRSLSLIPENAIGPIRTVAGALTILSMAALGLGVDLRVVKRVGGKVAAAVTSSLLFLFAVSILFVRYGVPP